MAERSGAARCPDGRDRARPDALAHWHLQEITPLAADDPALVPPETLTDGPRMAGGWWLVPAVLLSVPVWIALARLMLRAFRP